ncbi:MAG: hypothetical protein NTU57_02390 [Candidatus Aenigmarchaeota archaeon]|nr:hypothetical protein [Candidatus Aenigmarchaeota archaeon]
MDYEKERDLNIMIILVLVSVIMVLWFGSTLEAFRAYAPAFFAIMMIAVWLVAMNVGRFGKKWKK